MQEESSFVYLVSDIVELGMEEEESSEDQYTLPSHSEISS